MGRPKASEADPLRKSKRGRPSKHRREDYVIHTGFDGHANAPWRKTVSIFKQPVTLVHTSGRDTKKATDQQLKNGLLSSRPQEKPAPVMWAKALENVQALIPTAVADKPITVQPEDIAAQERRVLDARKRLQEVIKHFG
ncbi:unnamed protein product [Angiostrongylus costaricensis]|uniref:MBD_C domain-containing protein n=1 Tax=Angiostrongylus costaricensis TaxID=334426 RepID=A0A0R3PFR4_ANGCS|nr:unnamed protein product [Angiostrongylus costaricensis]